MTRFLRTLFMITTTAQQLLGRPIVAKRQSIIFYARRLSLVDLTGVGFFSNSIVGFGGGPGPHKPGVSGALAVSCRRRVLGESAPTEIDLAMTSAL